MNNKENSEITIEGPVTITDVGELHGEFKCLISKNHDIVINCSCIEGIDAAALQLFVSIVHKAENNKILITWKDPSKSFKDAACMMGLANEIGLEN